MTSTGVLAREVLEDAGWETLDAERPSPGAISDVSRIDLWVFGLPKDGFAEGLRKLAALKAQAPDMRIVVIAPFIQDAYCTLPEYMVPERVISLARLPLLPNAKIDRQALIAASTGPRTTLRRGSRHAFGG